MLLQIRIQRLLLRGGPGPFPQAPAGTCSPDCVRVRRLRPEPVAPIAFASDNTTVSKELYTKREMESTEFSIMFR